MRRRPRRLPKQVITHPQLESRDQDRDLTRQHMNSVRKPVHHHGLILGNPLLNLDPNHRPSQAPSRLRAQDLDQYLAPSPDRSPGQSPDPSLDPSLVRGLEVVVRDQFHTPDLSPAHPQDLCAVQGVGHEVQTIEPIDLDVAGVVVVVTGADQDLHEVDVVIVPEDPTGASVTTDDVVHRGHPEGARPHHGRGVDSHLDHLH